MIGAEAGEGSGIGGGSGSLGGCCGEVGGGRELWCGAGDRAGCELGVVLQMVVKAETGVGTGLGLGVAVVWLEVGTGMGWDEWFGGCVTAGRDGFVQYGNFVVGVGEDHRYLCSPHMYTVVDGSY